MSTTLTEDGGEPAVAAVRQRWLVLTFLSVTMFMIILDLTTVYTALPTIQDDLGFSASGLQWVVTGYMLSFGGLMLLGGRLADVLGRRRMFMAGNAIIVGASLLAGLAWDSGILVTARFLQGAGAAVVAPAALSILMVIFEEGSERNKALGVWSAVAMVGATAGFVVGGPLTDGPGWEWIFLMNVPVGLMALGLSPLLLPEGRDESAAGRRFDLAGAATITAALAIVVYAIAEVPNVGWTDLRTVGLAIVAAALAMAFLAIEARSADPLVPLRLFRSRTLVGGNLVLFLSGIIIDGPFVLITLYMQDVLGYSPTRFAWAMVIPSVAGIVGALVGQRLVTRFGFRVVAAAGVAAMGVSLALFTQISATGSFAGDVLVGMLILNVGMAAMFVAATIAALTGIAEADSGIASGIEETAGVIGSPFGVAIMTTVAVSRTDHLVEGGTEPVAAQVEGYQFAFGALIGIAVVGVSAALALLRSPDERTGQPGEVVHVGDD